MKIKALLSFSKLSEEYSLGLKTGIISGFSWCWLWVTILNDNISMLDFMVSISLLIYSASNYIVEMNKYKDDG